MTQLLYRKWSRYTDPSSEKCWWWCDSQTWFKEECPGHWARFSDGVRPVGFRNYWWNDITGEWLHARNMWQWSCELPLASLWLAKDFRRKSEQPKNAAIRTHKISANTKVHKTKKGHPKILKYEKPGIRASKHTIGHVEFLGQVGLRWGSNWSL